MAGIRPGPMCVTTAEPIDSGTSCLTTMKPPGPTGADVLFATPPAFDFYNYSHAIKTVADMTFTVAPSMTLDGFLRHIYDKANEGIQAQANAMLKEGRITVAESSALVNSRNELLLRIRSKLSPFGLLYSEILKPRSSLKSFEEFLESKGSVEAVLRSVGKTRAVVDKIAVVSRAAGPASIALEITLTAVVIQKAPQRDRGHVAAEQIGGLSGGFIGGAAGMWAGCATAAALASPSLVIPFVGPVTTGGACLVGGMMGGIGVGWLGRGLGEAAGVWVHDAIHTSISDFSPTKSK
jgi:hypothetical protein